MPEIVRVVRALRRDTSGACRPVLIERDRWGNLLHDGYVLEHTDEIVLEGEWRVYRVIDPDGECDDPCDEMPYEILLADCTLTEK